MKYVPYTTPEYFLGSLPFKCLDLSIVSTSVVAKNCRDYKISLGGNKSSPDRAAVEFYCLNHMMSILQKKFGRNELLPEWAHNTCLNFETMISDQVRRMFYYMLLICTRESRHLRRDNKGKKCLDEVIEKFGMPCKLFNDSLFNLGSEEAADKFMDNPPPTTLGQYVWSLEYIFRHGSFSSSFGGKPWAEIALTLAKFVSGQISLEVMIDTAYTLAHNNGPMFNKGMMYLNYTSKFIEILDIQRAGQIPNLVLSGEMMQSTANLKGLVQTFSEHVPGEFTDKVDYEQVQKLGAVGDYSMKIEKKKAKHAVPDDPGYKAVSQFAYWPGESTTVYKRVG